MDRSEEMKDKRDGDRNDEKWKDAYDDEENMSVWVAGTRSSSVWMSNFICQDTACAYTWGTQQENRNEGCERENGRDICARQE